MKSSRKKKNLKAGRSEYDDQPWECWVLTWAALSSRDIAISLQAQPTSESRKEMGASASQWAALNGPPGATPSPAPGLQRLAQRMPSGRAPPQTSRCFRAQPHTCAVCLVPAAVGRKHFQWARRGDVTMTTLKPQFPPCSGRGRLGRQLGSSTQNLQILSFFPYSRQPGLGRAALR